MPPFLHPVSLGVTIRVAADAVVPVYATVSLVIALQSIPRLRNDFLVVSRLETGRSETCFNLESKNLSSVDSSVALEGLRYVYEF